jgi:tetratricopeptide (TPR) repeat protein
VGCCRFRPETPFAYTFGVPNSDDSSSSRPETGGAGARPAGKPASVRRSPGSARAAARKGQPTGPDAAANKAPQASERPWFAEGNTASKSREARPQGSSTGRPSGDKRSVGPRSASQRTSEPYEKRAPRPVRQLNRRLDAAAPLLPSPRKSDRPRSAGAKQLEKAPWQAEKWVDEGPVRDAAEAAVARAEPSAEPRERSKSKPLPPEVVVELQQAVGAKRAVKLEERLDAARGAFERERYSDAKRIIAKLAEEAPGAPAVRELYGLTLYRLERWRQAAGEMEAYRLLTDSYDQHPVLADCYRALKRFSTVEELWDELRAASPSAEIVAEGRIVYAGSLADREMFAEAIALLEKAAAATPKKVKDHHIRTWYALADLYDRAGNVPRARQLFRQINDVLPGFADVEYRLGGLGR